MKDTPTKISFRDKRKKKSGQEIENFNRDNLDEAGSVKESVEENRIGAKK